MENAGGAETGASMKDIGGIQQICRDMREVFDSVLVAANVSGVAGTCLCAAILLQQTLERFHRCETVVRGGDGAQDSGAQDPHGRWHGHYWVEGVTEDGGPFLADITGDQFGWPPVIVLPLAAARSRYRPGDDQVVSVVVDEELDRMVRDVGPA